MDDLRAIYVKIGLRNVQSYVQSGNIIFSDKKSNPAELERTISEAIRQEFKFDTAVIVLSEDNLKEIIGHNPFKNDTAKDPSNQYVTFLASVSEKLNPGEISARVSPGEEIGFWENAVYLYCPGGYGRTKLNNNFLEKKLRVTATTRNWKTTNELLKIAQGIRG